MIQIYILIIGLLYFDYQFWTAKINNGNMKMNKPEIDFLITKIKTSEILKILKPTTKA